MQKSRAVWAGLGAVGLLAASLAWARSGDGPRVTVERDEAGNLIRECTYDDRGNLIQVREPVAKPVAPERTVTTFEYDKKGRILSITDRNGPSQAPYLYDPTAPLVQVREVPHASR